MKWMRFRVRTNEESEDIIISYLEDIGLEGAQIEDNAPLSAADKEQMFIDAPELEPDEKDNGIEAGAAYLNFFLEIDDDNMLTSQCDESVLNKISSCTQVLKRSVMSVRNLVIRLNLTSFNNKILWVPIWERLFLYRLRLMNY